MKLHPLTFTCPPIILRLSKSWILLICCLYQPAIAQENPNGPIQILDAWARPLPAVSKHGAAFVTIKNSGEKTERLMIIQTTKAQTVELHNHIHENGVMKMRRLDSIAVDPGDTIEFGPGGLHVMLLDLQSPLNKGESFALTLVFESKIEITVEVKIANPGEG